MFFKVIGLYVVTITIKVIMHFMLQLEIIIPKQFIIFRDSLITMNTTIHNQCQ